MRTQVKMLQVCFEDPPIVYDMMLYTHEDTSYAMFVRHEEGNRWVTTRIPFVLSSDPELLKEFTETLLTNGYVLKTLRNDPAVKSKEGGTS